MLGLWVRKGRDAKNASKIESVGKLKKLSNKRGALTLL